MMQDLKVKENKRREQRSRKPATAKQRRESKQGSEAREVSRGESSAVLVGVMMPFSALAQLCGCPRNPNVWLPEKPTEQSGQFTVK